MSNQEAFYSQLYQYIEKIANQVSDLRGSDTIKTGTIIQVLPGHYVVQLNEGNEQSSVKAIALNTNDLFSLQDYVYLMQATGSIENTYFIIGKVEQIQEDFLNLTLTERFTSSNELSGDLLKLNTKIEDLTILSDIKANRVFQIKGTFTCNKSNEENEENYGLKVSFNCGDQVIKTYNLDTNYFIGQPFKMTSQPQMRTILLDEVVLKSNFDNIIITKFGSNFTCSDITIASGSLLDVNGIVNVSLSFKNKKDYFSLSGTEVDNSIKVNAEVEYEGAPLVAPGIQYYWLLKDDSIDENSKYYFSYAGKGWKCLNTYDNVSGVGADGFSLTLQIWESGENNIILSETGFPDFINTFKCIVKYQDIVVSSPETTIYNYNKESFFVELESNIQPPLLILETDQVILSAVVEDENEKTHMSDYTCAYQWQVENENGDWEVVTKKEESEGVFEDTFAFNEYNAEHVLTKDWSKLTIVDQLLSDIMEGDSSFYVLHGEGEEITKNFRCVVRVYRKDDLLNYVSKDDLSNYVSEDFSESMQVVSKVAIAAQLVSTTYYKYYISDTPYTLFPKLANKEGDWEGDWSISIKRISEEEEEYFVSQNWTEDSNLAHWSSDGLQEFPRGQVNQDAYNYIIGNFIENPQKGSYLYITSQEVWVEKRLKKINFLRKDNWTPPVLAKGYSENGNYLDDKAVDKLNTFTHLTEGGLKKGLLYDEKTGDVYINADFINTGALRVADDEGESIFYADVGTGKVEIAGFTVDENNISHGDKETGDYYVYLGTDGLNVGNVLDVTIDEDGKASASFTGSFEIKDFTDSTGTIASKDEVKNVQENLDSAQKQLTKEITSTKNIINGVKADLQNQIDGNITTWYGEGVPTFSNTNNETINDDPAKDWTDAEKNTHNGDLYYDKTTGKCYRWQYEDENTYSWVLITDTDIAKALADAAEAQTTADNKKRIFYGTASPKPPYDYGDAWMQGENAGDGAIKICQYEPGRKETELYNEDDWVLASDFVTQNILNNAIEATNITIEENYKKVVENLDNITASIYFKASVLEQQKNDGTITEIPAVFMKALDKDTDYGLMYFNTDQLIIRSRHLMLNHNGAYYTPGYFTIDTDNFKINESGNVTVTGTINATSLNIGATQQSFDSIQQKINNDIKTATDAATAAQQYAEGVSATVSTLTNATLPATYLGVNTDWIYIKSKTENTASPGKIFFDTDALVINSDHLKLNHNGNSYSAGNLIINTDNLKVNVNGDNAVSVKGALEATSLTISQDVAKKAGLGSQVSDNLLFDSAKEITNQYSPQSPEFVQSSYDLSPVFKKYGLVPYTLSFDLQAPVTGSVQVYCQNGSGSEYSFSKEVAVESVNTWKRYKVTFTPYKTDQSTYTSSLLAFYGEYNTGRVPRIRNIKLELGDTGLLVPPWSPAVEESAAPNENLAVSTALSISGKTDNDKFLGNKFSLSLGTNYSGVGVKINSDIFKKPGTFSDPIDAYDFEAEYVLSFKYREVNSDGTVRTGQPLVHHIGGRASWFTPTKIIYTNNGNQYHATPHADGSLSWSNPTPLPGNLNGELYIRAYFRTHSKANCSSVDDWNLYIQPRRPADVYTQPVYCEIWDVKVEKGTIATGWQVAKKDTETFFNVDPSTGNITLKAANSLSLTGDKFEITSGNFKVSTTGKVTATDLHVSQGTIADWSITPKLQVHDVDYFHKLVSEINSSNKVTNWNSLYIGGITSSNLYALSTQGLHVEYVDEDADFQRQVISFTWPQLAKTLLKCVGIKSGKVDIPAGNKEWVFEPAFTTSYGSLYRVICTPSEKFSSANIMTSAYWEQEPNGRTTYYVGRKRDSGDEYPTTIGWIAIPIGVFGFHYDISESYDNMKLLD